MLSSDNSVGMRAPHGFETPLTTLIRRESQCEIQPTSYLVRKFYFDWVYVFIGIPFGSICWVFSRREEIGCRCIDHLISIQRSDRPGFIHLWRRRLTIDDTMTMKSSNCSLRYWSQIDPSEDRCLKAEVSPQLILFMLGPVGEVTYKESRSGATYD